jgi:hypothetical protein
VVEKWLRCRSNSIRACLVLLLGLSLLTGILFGLVPAIRATRLDLTPTLKDTGRSSSAISRSWIARSLVVVQVSLSVLLLIGAGLLIRTLRNLQHVDAGFNTTNLLLFRVDPSLIGYKEEKLTALYHQLSDQIETVPGVRSATFSQHTLLSGSGTNSSVYIPGVIGPNGKPIDSGNAYIHSVRENFLQTMEIPLLRGRTLTSHDDAHAPRVALVNETFAKQFLHTDDPGRKAIQF